MKITLVSDVYKNTIATVSAKAWENAESGSWVELECRDASMALREKTYKAEFVKSSWEVYEG